ncbi:MAG: adenosylhomocysteine nucleosidase [Clostridia bacterium]|jgi:adenosylhomocysteine nucleosidase|nr:adenosylhomocysteine nucleosidase [Clostridia bacterium]
MIGIIGAMKEEKDAILSLMQQVERVEHYGVKFYIGTINNKSCVLSKSGVGKVNAARATQIMIDKFSPEFIINIGSAGALEPSLEIGDIVISDNCIQHDADITAFGHPKGYIAGLRYIQADPELIEMCKKAMELSVGHQYKTYIGTVASGDQFISSQEKKQELHREFNAWCAEMEGAAIAQVCYLCQVPYVVIRSISDKALPGNNIEFREFLELSAERCAHFVDVFTR